jgi:hypothetical protein
MPEYGAVRTEFVIFGKRKGVTGFIDKHAADFDKEIAILFFYVFLNGKNAVRFHVYKKEVYGIRVFL